MRTRPSNEEEKFQDNSVGISAAFVEILFCAFGVTRIFSYATAHRSLKFGERRTRLSISLKIVAGNPHTGRSPSFPRILVGMTLIGGAVGVVFPITISLISRHFPIGKMGIAVFVLIKRALTYFL